MLIVDESLDLVSATFTQDNKSGTRTTLELKRPGDDDKDGDKTEGKHDVRTGNTSTSTTPSAPPRTGTPGGDTPF